MKQRIVRLGGEGEWCNTYVLGEEGGPCLMVDFGNNAGHRLEAYIARHHSLCLGILLTHGHYDHIAGLSQFEKRDIPLFMMAEDERCLEDPTFNCSFSLRDESIVVTGIHPTLVSDQEILTLGPWKIRVIATPFHTAGSCCYYLEDDHVLFSGDTLFRFGVGRDDLRGSVPRKMEESLGKLAKLPKETKVFPGHGPSTTIGDEFPQ